MTPIALALVVAVVQPGSASATVQTTQDKVRSALSTWFKSEGPARARAREQARKAVSELIDFDALAKATLGSKWDEVKASDRGAAVDATGAAVAAVAGGRAHGGVSFSVDVDPQ